MDHSDTDANTGAEASILKSLANYISQDLFFSLPGITLPDFLGLVWRRRNVIAAHYYPRLVFQACVSAFVSANRFRENRLETAMPEPRTLVACPVFIIGHWRSGTTFLHQLLACDPQFVWPNMYQSSMPHSFLSTERWAKSAVQRFLPETRLFDNVKLNLDAPWEDETALCTTTLLSPVMASVFPRRASEFLPYLSFEHATPGEKNQWLSGLLLFLRKLTSFRAGRPLLKSPPHTARIELLSSAFPNARFVHIHRNPYEVYLSTLHMRRLFGRVVQLETPRPGDLEEYTITEYKQMHESYFRQRFQFGSGSLIEVSYDDAVNKPLDTVERIYRQLDLGDVSAVRPAIRDYTAKLAGYKRNVFKEIPPVWKQRIMTEWKQSFEMWGYPL